MKGKTYYLYIFRLLKKETSNGIFRITKQSISVINSMLLSILKTLCKNSDILMGENKKTLSVKEITTSLSLLLSTDLFCTVKDFCSAKVIKYNLSSRPVMTTSEKTTRQSKADLIFPVALTENLLRFYMHGGKNVSRLCPVYVTAALQILTTILFTLITTRMRKHKKLLITIRYIREAVKDSQSYSSLLQSTNFAFFHGNVAIKKKNTIKDEPDLLQHSPLNRLVKEIVNGHSPNVVLRYTPDFLLNIQAYVEESIFALAGKAAKLTAFAKRDTTYVQDVKLAQELSNNSIDSQRVYITALPEANIRRIVLRGGIKRIGDGTLDAFRTYVNDLLEKILFRMVQCALHKGVHTLSCDIFDRTFQLQNQSVSILVGNRKKRAEKGSTTEEEKKEEVQRPIVGSLNELSDIEEEREEEKDSDSE